MINWFFESFGWHITKGEGRGRSSGVQWRNPSPVGPSVEISNQVKQQNNNVLSHTTSSTMMPTEPLNSTVEQPEEKGESLCGTEVMASTIVEPSTIDVTVWSLVLDFDDRRIRRLTLGRRGGGEEILEVFLKSIIQFSIFIFRFSWKTQVITTRNYYQEEKRVIILSTSTTVEYVTCRKTTDDSSPWNNIRRRELSYHIVTTTVFHTTNCNHYFHHVFQTKTHFQKGPFLFFSTIIDFRWSSNFRQLTNYVFCRNLDTWRFSTVDELRQLTLFCVEVIYDDCRYNVYNFQSSFHRDLYSNNPYSSSRLLFNLFHGPPPRTHATQGKV